MTTGTKPRPVDKVTYPGDPNEVWLPPLDMADEHPDEQETAKVYIVVYYTFCGREPKDMSWAVSWDVPTNKSTSFYHRFITLHPVNGQNHLVYFGALTKIVTEMPCAKIPLGDFSRAKRDDLEALAKGVDVYHPATNGGWTSQHWVGDLLCQAGEQGILDKTVVEKSLVEAKNLRYPKISTTYEDYLGFLPNHDPKVTPTCDLQWSGLPLLR